MSALSQRPRVPTKVTQLCAELIRIEATLWGRFYPGFKEAPHASEGVF